MKNQLIVANKKIEDYAYQLYGNLVKSTSEESVDMILKQISDITIQDTTNTKLTQLSVLGVKTNPELVVEVLKNKAPDIALDLAVIGAIELTKMAQNNPKALLLKGDDK